MWMCVCGCVYVHVCMCMCVCGCAYVDVCISACVYVLLFSARILSGLNPLITNF